MMALKMITVVLSTVLLAEFTAGAAQDPVECTQESCPDPVAFVEKIAPGVTLQESSPDINERRSEPVFKDEELELQAPTDCLSYSGCPMCLKPDGDRCCESCMGYMIPFFLSPDMYVVHLHWLGFYQMVEFGICGLNHCYYCCHHCTHHYMTQLFLVSNTPINSIGELVDAHLSNGLSVIKRSVPNHCKCVGYKPITRT